MKMKLSSLVLLSSVISCSNQDSDIKSEAHTPQQEKEDKLVMIGDSVTQGLFVNTELGNSVDVMKLYSELMKILSNNLPTDKESRARMFEDLDQAFSSRKDTAIYKYVTGKLGVPEPIIHASSGANFNNTAALIDGKHSITEQYESPSSAPDESVTKVVYELGSNDFCDYYGYDLEDSDSIDLGRQQFRDAYFNSLSVTLKHYSQAELSIISPINVVQASSITGSTELSAEGLGFSMPLTSVHKIYCPVLDDKSEDLSSKITHFKEDISAVWDKIAEENPCRKISTANMMDISSLTKEDFAVDGYHPGSKTNAQLSELIASRMVLKQSGSDCQK